MDVLVNNQLIDIDQVLSDILKKKVDTPLICHLHLTDTSLLLYQDESTIGP